MSRKRLTVWPRGGLHPAVGPCSAATQLKSEELSLPEGKVRVKLDHDGTVLDVDEDDIEKVRRRLLEGAGGGLDWALLPLAVEMRFCVAITHPLVLSHRRMLPPATGWRTWPHWCTSMSPACCTPCGSAMVPACSIPMPGPACWSSAPAGPPLCTPRR